MKRSKPRSAANSTFLEQLREHTFFLDRNFGRHKVAAELRSIGLTVEVHYDHFPEAEAGEKGDADWIRDVSNRGWIILTRDENIRRNPLELAALRISKARAFNFKNAQATAAEIANAFKMAAGKIARVIRNSRPPYIVGISLRGEITYRGTRETERAQMTAREPAAAVAHRRRIEKRAVASNHLTLPPLPVERYDIVYVDPPWHYYGSGVKDAAAAKHYPLMSQEQLANLDIKSILTKRAAVFMWATGPRLHFAIELIAKWGLHYRGVAYVWVKTNKRGGIIAGQGVPPTFTKPTTELLLVATTNRTGRPFPIHDMAQAQVVLHGRGAHSEKPEIFRNMIEALCGDRARIELFARKHILGWDAWGAEVGKLNA